MKRLVLFACATLSASVFGATVTVVAPQEGAAKSVTVGGKSSMAYSQGKQAPLKAVPNPGWVFAGWYAAYDAETGVFSKEAGLSKGADWRSPSADYTVGAGDATLYARFASPAEDSLSFDLAGTFAGVTEASDDFDRPVLPLAEALDFAVGFNSLSLPVVAVKGLPSGLSFDKSSLRVSGRTKAPGVSRLEVSAKNASGYAFSQVFYVRVANSVSEHVEGFDSSDFEAGVEVYEYLEDYFDISNTNATLKSVALSGLPPGLSLVSEKDDGETHYYIEGAPKSAGEFTVVCKATFSDGTVESASALFSVSGPDPFDYDVDFSGLEGHSVGDSLSEEVAVVVGEYDVEYKTGVTAVSGLPAGIAASKVDSGDGTVLYVLRGMFSKAGEFTVSAKVAYEDWESEKIATATVSQKIVVGDSAGAYVTAEVLDDALAQAKCKASGSGVYAAGASAKLSASAGAGYVFAGWCDAAGVPMPAGAQDYRKSPLVLQVTADAELDWFANFIPKDEDFIDLSALGESEGMVVDTASGEKSSLSFAVASGTLPTLKFDNLPEGIVCEPSSENAGEYVLYYDPYTASKRPSPGKYTVVATGVNSSRMSDSAKFQVTVLNYVDKAIKVDGDYGVLTPDVAMAPISLSGAVDFAHGETLDVSGLPAGLVYDRNAYVISGVPTKPGSYTLAFTARVNAEDGSTRTGVATAFIAVKDYPTVAAVVSDEARAAGNKVTGGGSFKSGTAVTLKAAAAKGWVFAGWGEGSGAKGLAALSPSLTYVVGTDDYSEIEATFLEIRDDGLFVDDPGVVRVVRNASFATNLVDSIVVSRSLPAISVSGLPNGLKYDSKTYLISGVVGSSAKSGYYYATLSAKNAGGYAFTRILKFVVVDSPSADIPSEPELPNAAGIDFSPLDDLCTGDFCPEDGLEAVALYVEPSDGGADVSAVSVSGLPAGLKSSITVAEGMAEIVLYGTPSKPGRCALKVAVTYSDRSKATSEYAFTVQDGGCAWLDVSSFDKALGSVSGSGVYASGASVKISAKPAQGRVFAGWYEDEAVPFAGIAAMDGVDYRTANATFVFRREMFANASPTLVADFVAKSAETDAVAIAGFDDTWEISPAEDSELLFEVASASLPKLTVSGLPKGVALDAARGRFVYSSASAAQIAPGYYTVTLKAANQSNASATAKLPVFVANKTTDAIGGLDPAPDAYPLYAAVELYPELIVPEVDVAGGWKLAAAGLPSGLKLVQDKASGAYSVVGVAAKAGTNTVTFTATRGKEKEVATITLAVAELPAWACGTYDGAYFEFDEEATNMVGQVTASVSAAGKLSGKILKGGKSYSFAAAGYGAYDADAGVFTAEVDVQWTSSDKESFLLSVGASENGLGFINLEPIGDGAHFAGAVQNAWLRKDLATPAFATGAKQPVLEVSNKLCCGLETPHGLVLKFGADGAVAVSGVVEGVSASGKSQALFMGADGSGIRARVYVYVASGKLTGGVFCKAVDVVLSDSDGDGKLDKASAAD